MQVFVGQPYLEKKQPVSLAPLPQRRSSAAADNGNGAAANNEKLFLGRTMQTWSKIGALGFMFFCILFNYTILRDTKVR